jgi:predicted nucleic acid-binding protein
VKIVAKRLGSIPAGIAVFIDANVFHFYLRGPKDVRKESTKFLERIENGEISGYTSTLVLDELMYKILLRKIEEKHKQNPLIIIEKNFDEIGKNASYVKEAIEIVLGISELKILEVTMEDLQNAADLMELFSLLPRDAVHLSVMLSHGIKDIASSDNDFDRVKDLTRWTPI